MTCPCHAISANRWPYYGRYGSLVRWVLDPIDGTINFKPRQPALCCDSRSRSWRDGQPDARPRRHCRSCSERYLAAQRGLRRLPERSRESARRDHRPASSDADHRTRRLHRRQGVRGGEPRPPRRCCAVWHATACACACTAPPRSTSRGSPQGALNATLMLSNLPWDVTAGLLLVREAGGDRSTTTTARRHDAASDVHARIDPVARGPDLPASWRRRCEPTRACSLAVFAPSPLLTITIEPGPARPPVHLHPGGQGFWVARLAATLGADVTLCCALGGEPGRVLAQPDRSRSRSPFSAAHGQAAPTASTSTTAAAASASRWSASTALPLGSPRRRRALRDRAGRRT